MPVALASIVSPSFGQSDWLKLLGIAGAMLVLYVLAKKVSGGDETISPSSEISPPVEMQPQSIEPPDIEEADEDDPEQLSDEGDQSAEQEKQQPRNIRIINWNFESFDLSTGPPDPDRFADDLLVELYDSSTGRSWQQTYSVATPTGLGKMLRDRNWSSMVVPQTLILTRYDLKELRAAILDELGAIESQRGDVSDETSDAAPAGGG